MQKYLEHQRSPPPTSKSHDINTILFYMEGKGLAAMTNATKPDKISEILQGALVHSTSWSLSVSEVIFTVKLLYSLVLIPRSSADNSAPGKKPCAQ